MTKREIVRMTLEGGQPPYTPWSFRFTAEPQQALCRHYACDAGDLIGHTGCHILELGSDIGFFDEIATDRFRDVFGVVWDRSMDKDIGMPVDYLLEEPGDLDSLVFPNPCDPRFFADIDARIDRYPDRFRLFCLGFSLFERAWTLRSMENLLIDMIEAPEFVHALLTRIADYNIAQVREALKHDIDAVYFGDDWGQQRGLIMGHEKWREFIYPQLKRMYAATREAGKFQFIHSCGDVDELFDDLIGIGLNCFNPFQPEVMDVRSLLSAYRGRLSFWGGISTQKTMPYGSPDEVRAQVREMIDLGRAGGYILSPSHALESDVPMENILALIETAQNQLSTNTPPPMKQRLSSATLKVCPAAEKQPAANGQWSVEKAKAWYDDQLWPCGFNYIPANAINYTEMWMPYNFDPEFISKELALAEDIGFNCLRVVLPFVVWEHDPDAFKKCLDTFLGICEKHGIKVMFCLFEDCGELRNPQYGQQPDVLKGAYANAWSASPGDAMTLDPATWPRLERYLKDVISSFKDDSRVLAWDLYNEPTNGGMRKRSLPLVTRAFEWARAVNSSAPLTVGVWNSNEELNAIALGNSDIITFHNYHNADKLVAGIESLKPHGRPIINTEWLCRHQDSTPQMCLPIFARENIGCMHWGLVNGMTQTHLCWGARPGDPEPKVWQHDLYHGDHTPYDKEEIELFRRTIRQKAK